ncbi:NADH dehydrogenase [Panicum miliaceum]|uniref:NADH dehydrogenase n=1 Tax=Panicum miliaceum TaxID=4540 RepID=A0A3L6PJ26_PANMI|nr:NADH dehydrogenase [Panicum miliaceum]
MGGGGTHGGTNYKGYTIPHNKRWHTVAGKGLCAVMWVCAILGMGMMITLMAMDMDMNMRCRQAKLMDLSLSTNRIAEVQAVVPIFSICCWCDLPLPAGLQLS